MSTAILILTREGLALARRLRDACPEGIAIFGPSCVVGACGGSVSRADEAIAIGDTAPLFATAEPGVFGWLGPLRLVFPTIWERHDSIVAVMALGIVVRLAGPLARDKRLDPAVVVVDDAGRFAISVLGGHGAGANALTRRVAEVLGAQPVVTTASEARGLPAVDQVGRDQGWTIERTENLTRVAAAVVRHETVAVWQDAGSLDWWRPFGPWPSHFHRLRSWDELPGLRASALLVISDRLEPENLPEEQTLVYRPPTLVAGIGCRRGVSLETIAAWTESVLTAHGLAAGSLAALATVTLKVDEPGLLAFAAVRQLPLVAFPPAQLADQPGIETPSERVRSKIGIPAVAEPSALRASGASRLLVTKQKGPGVTVALARKPAPESQAN
ncbi:cobalt-precorrin 5A acetaldehyde-lyase [Singulisphaera sp. GP187]|uniref:cobalt-precorrin 5A hydrolase n=1 Tax=Singulisphaera sp. GP187 TaxID=1882752 RepID=UPI00092894E4|nr:cobalamin biosynthesis protein [Singulisphaera sp. GP187]SIO45812.1 cobalt-precorrin 5A acetaldehyde-lyase [Singulisphaera sp. GP187]